jgi:hypothetical protein
MKVARVMAAAVMAGLLLQGNAIAQQSPQAAQASGTTSGAAARDNVKSSGATQTKSGSATAGSTSAGAPGTTAKKGTESGAPPKR